MSSKLLAPVIIQNHPEQMVADGTQLSRVAVLCDNASVRNGLDDTVRVPLVTIVLQTDTSQWWKLNAKPGGGWAMNDTDWTAVPPPGGSVSPSGTGFAHVTSGTTDGAARVVNLASADVTGTLPLANEGAPTGSGFPHVTAGAWDGTARAVGLGSADVTGTLPLANQAAPTGTGFAHVTGGATDGAARAINLASADVTGTLALGSGGTGVTAVGSAGNFLRSNGTVWLSAAIQAGDLPAITLTGDTTGSAAGGSLATTTGKINGASVPAAGALTTGAVLRVTGASALGYGAVDLANANAVTGTLPTGNQAAQTMAGDVTGTTAASVVGKINGATAPAAGALVTGNGLYVSGASALSYSALNLAGGAAWVTGTLPLGNGGTGVASSGAAGNFLRSNGTVWASAAIQSTDLTTALASPPAIGGTTPAAVTATTVVAQTSLDGSGATTDFHAGGTTLTILASEVVTGSSTKAPIRNGAQAAVGGTLTDNSTWVELCTIAAAVLANNTAHDIILKLLAADFSASSNTQISGDIATIWLEFLVTVSNAGVITLSAGTTNTTTTLTLTPVTGSTTSTIGGTTGTTCPLNGFRARVSSGAIVIEAQGATGKSYRVAVAPQSMTRIF